METTVWKEKCIGNKLNIYTSIQCVVSRGVTLGKLGILQSSDCTQWGIHSHFLFKWSQNNKQFWVDSFINPDHPSLSSLHWAFKLGNKLPYKAYFYNNSFQTVLLSKSYRLILKKRNRALRFSTNSNSFSGITSTEEHSGAATFPPIVGWVDYGQWADALTGHG